MEGVAQNF